MASRGYNKVTLVGNIGRDPELTYSPNGTAKVEFSLATGYSVKENDEWVDKAEWHRIVQWGNDAERTAEWYRKGSRVFIEGRLQTREYHKDGDAAGDKRYITEVVANIILGGGNRADSESAAPREARPTGEFRDPGPSRGPAPVQGREHDPYDDLPF